jgi:hypothetical protein
LVVFFLGFLAVSFGLCGLGFATGILNSPKFKAVKLPPLLVYLIIKLLQ